MIPMLAVSRFSRGGARAPRRSKVWLGAQIQGFSLAAAGTSVSTLILEGVLENQGKPTIARVRGSWIAFVDESASTEPTFGFVTAGIAVVSTKSVTAGVASLPLPATNVEFPWIWWDTIQVGSENSDTTHIGWNQEHIIDGKAMRKIPPASTLVAVFEASPSFAGTLAVDGAMHVRMLLMPS